MAARRKQKPTGLQRLTSWVILLILLGATVGAMAIWNVPALNDWQAAHERYVETVQRVERQRLAIARLEAEKQALATNLGALERAAREEYLLLKPDEQVYVFKERRRNLN
jgi:cell division protein FtsB